MSATANLDLISFLNAIQGARVCGEARISAPNNIDEDQRRAFNTNVIWVYGD
jgi:hypothetical protein